MFNSWLVLKAVMMQGILAMAALTGSLIGAASSLVGQTNTGQQPMTETAQAVWPAIGQITYGGAAGGAICTGTLVAPLLVLTAGHCVAVNGVPMQAGDIQFAAGWRDGKGRAVRTGAEIVLAKPSAGQPRSMSQDVALIVLDKPIESGEIQPLPLSRQDLFAEKYSFIGYRRDAPGVAQRDDSCALASTKPAVLVLDCQVVSGNSGGPVLTLRHGSWQVAGVIVAQAGGAASAQSYAVIPGDDLRARISGR